MINREDHRICLAQNANGARSRARSEVHVVAFCPRNGRCRIRSQKGEEFPKNCAAPRAYLAATTVGSKAMFAGGMADLSGGGPSDVVDIYDASTDKWTTAKLSQARYALAATSLGTKAMFASGTYLDPNLRPRTSQVVDIYDASTDTWAAVTPNISRSDFTWSESMIAASSGGKAIFAGGGEGSYRGSWVTAIYDETAQTWSTVDMRCDAAFLGGTAVGTTVFCAGGRYYGESSGVRTLNAVSMLDSVTNVTSNAKLSRPRDELVAVSVGRWAIFAGGRVEYDVARRRHFVAVDDVDIFDVSTGMWAWGVP